MLKRAASWREREGSEQEHGVVRVISTQEKRIPRRRKKGSKKASEEKVIESISGLVNANIFGRTWKALEALYFWLSLK